MTKFPFYSKSLNLILHVCRRRRRWSSERVWIEKAGNCQTKKIKSPLQMFLMRRSDKEISIKIEKKENFVSI